MSESEDDTSKPKKITGHLAKLTKYEMEERRKKVLQLRLRGMSVTAIAKIMSVSPSVVSGDLKKARQENKGTIDKIEQNDFIGESLAVFDVLQERTWLEYSQLVGKDNLVNQRLKALDLIRTIQKDKVDVLTEVGLIGEEDGPMEVEHVHRLEWTPEFQQKVARALIEQSLTSILPEPIPDEPAQLEEENVIENEKEEE